MKYKGLEESCPVCRGKDISPFLEIPDVPVHCNLIWKTRENAVSAPRGNIILAFCHCCGHIFNLAFDTEFIDYSGQYDSSLHFSERFKQYAHELAERLIAQYNLHEKTILEIGCGQGDFLKLICKLGRNRGVGFDPGFPSTNPVSEEDDLVLFIRDSYAEHYSEYRADLICCRHVLEHVRFPREFLDRIHRTIGDSPGTVLFFEVPNAGHIFKAHAIWDIIYEHCSYYTVHSLAALFSACGFRINSLYETYGGQFLCSEAEPLPLSRGTAGPGLGEKHMVLPDDLKTFAHIYDTTVKVWRSRLAVMKAESKNVVVWGAGSKGVTFLNTFDTGDQIWSVIDMNPRKQGGYVPGTGHQIMAPEFLRLNQPDIIIVMNPLYEAEIRQAINRLDLFPSILSVS